MERFFAAFGTRPGLEIGASRAKSVGNGLKKLGEIASF
jgi:hypothetical protein